MVSQTNTEVELFQLLQCHGTGQVELALPEGSISKSQQKVVMLISGSCQLISMEEKITSTYTFSFYIKRKLNVKRERFRKNVENLVELNKKTGYGAF